MKYKNTRKVLCLWVAILACAFCQGSLALAAPSKNPLKAPKIILKDAQIIAISFDGIHIELALHVSNPNDQTITVEALSYRFTIEEAIPMSGHIQKREVFPAQKNRELSIALALPYGPATSALMQVLSSNEKSTSYKLSGSVALLNNPKPYPFSHQGTLPALKSMRL